MTREHIEDKQNEDFMNLLERTRKINNIWEVYDFGKIKLKSNKQISKKIYEQNFLMSAILDSFIKQKIKLKFVLTNGIRYGNYYIASHNGELVIIGAAEDKYESAKVLELISSTRGIKKVINYVEVRNIDD